MTDDDEKKEGTIIVEMPIVFNGDPEAFAKQMREAVLEREEGRNPFDPRNAWQEDERRRASILDSLAPDPWGLEEAPARRWRPTRRTLIGLAFAAFFLAGILAGYFTR